MTSPDPSQPRLRLAAVSMVRDEADIIELFVRINLRTVERLYILDHGSTDATAEIIKRLQAEGLPLSYVHHASDEFQQSQVITHLVNQVANMGVFDYIVPLDADEFIDDPSGQRLQTLDQHLPRDRWGKAPWRTYCPISGDYFGPSAPLYSNFRPRSAEPTRMRKVILGGRFARGCTVLEGNHKAYNLALNNDPVELPHRFNHVPVRHSEQIMRKALLGSRSLALKSNRFAGEGNHWDRLATEIRQRKHQLDDDWLRHHALQYMNALGDQTLRIEEDGPRLGLPTDVMRYKDLAYRPLSVALDAFVGDLVKQIQSLQQQLTQQGAPS